MDSIVQSSSSNECVHFQGIDGNFETYFLIWLDRIIHSKDHLSIKEKLRSTISYLEVFDQIDHCHSYIQSISTDDRIVFIVNEHFSRDIIPQIHHLQQIFSIYILCIDKELHQTWSEQYHKVFPFHVSLTV